MRPSVVSAFRTGTITLARVMRANCMESIEPSTLRRRADRPDPRLLLAGGPARRRALHARAGRGPGAARARGRALLLGLGATAGDRRRGRHDQSAAGVEDGYRPRGGLRPADPARAWRCGRFDAVHSLGRHDALASIRAARLHPRRRTVITDLGPARPGLVGGRGRARGARGREGRGGDRRLQLHVADSRSTSWPRTTAASDGVVVPGGVDLEIFAPADGAGAGPDDPVLGRDHRAAQGGAGAARRARDHRRVGARRASCG